MEHRILIDDFNNRLLSAYSEKYNNQHEIIDTMMRVDGIDIFEFLEIYISSSYYNEDIIERLIYTLMDIKLQMFFIFEVEIGQYNSRVIDRVETFEAITAHDFVYLTKLNIDQNLILKTRILFERIMNFVYMLENGKLLEGKSKKGKFENFLNDNKKWCFLLETIEKLRVFDDVFRTPEVHKFSSLRRMFMSKEDDKSEEFCFDLINSFQNSIYPNILMIIQGHEPGYKSWGKISAKQNDKLDPFFREPDWVKENENARVIGNFNKPHRLEFKVANKRPEDICEHLINEKNMNVLLTHNSKYNSKGELINLADKIWIICEETEIEMVKSLVTEYMYK